MILADKLIRLRKKSGWTQEELAELVNVSRQAVAKWEGAQTVPTLEKILQLAELFGVTTDYLLKDDIEEEELIDSQGGSNIKCVTLAEANQFLAWRKTASVRIAIATFLCMLSVIPLLILGAAAECLPYGISDTAACVIGLGILLVMVAAAAAIFILCGFQNGPYAFLDQDMFEIEYGVKGLVKAQQKAYQPTYFRYNTIGACICILSPIPLFAGAWSEQEFLMVVSLAGTILLAGAGVMLFIVAGIRWASMQKLLQEGDFTRLEKRRSKVKESVAAIYWLVAAAVYLGWSLGGNNWQISWVVFPVAGVLFGGIMILCNLITGKES